MHVMKFEKWQYKVSLHRTCMKQADVAFEAMSVS